MPSQFSKRMPGKAMILGNGQGRPEVCGPETVRARHRYAIGRQRTLNGTEAPPPTTSATKSAVRLEGDLQSELSRWLWLVKWVLLIPHAVVLVFLWLAVVVTTIAAFFAIVCTARYPRMFFDFNVGVMRWTWRVLFYGHRVLGTDRYPAFRLAAAPDDEARLEITYPQQLSRARVLVKSWLLALPHYLILFAFASLAGILALCAAVTLLFTKTYPKGVFDFLLGVHRWTARVIAYAALMTDDYPPFRLDQGGAQPTAAP